ncbi:MAG: S46 family peptidase, partial [Calditrichales bacterium]
AIKLASRIKGLSNRMKNYRGKLTGMKRLNLVNERKKSEQELQSFIQNDVDRNKQYGTVLQQIEALYEERGAQESRDLLLSNFISSSTLLRNATTIFNAAENRVKPDIERESSYMARNIEKTKRSTYLSEKSYYPQAEKEILKNLLNEIDKLPANQRFEPIDTFILKKGVYAFLDQLFSKSQFSDSKFLGEAFDMDMEKLKTLSDPALTLVMALDPLRKDKEKRDDQHSGALNKLHAQLIDIKKEFYSNKFIPDANSTFRLTYGYIRGYHPKDAVYNSPITTFRGVVEKTNGKAPFITPPALLDLYKQKNFGQFFNPVLKDVPVALLYNTDTTGGNSGSPLLNSKGQLVGVNFDRAWEATINDFAWSEDYSRSIAVDIRYVLWVTQKFSGADYLLTEMNIPLE